MTLLDSELVLTMVAETADAVIIVDRRGAICYWNHGAERVFGHPASKMIGSNLDVIIPPRLQKRHQDGFNAAIIRGSTKYGEGDLLAVPAMTANGRTVSIEFTVTLLCDAQGSVHHIGAIIRDVTERRAREQETRKRLEGLSPGRP